MRRTIIAILMLVLFLFPSIVLAEDITISSSVDRTEIEFGDSLELTVSIKKPMENQPMTHNFGGNGFSFSFNSSSFSSMSGLNDIDFDIENIPGFDIAGRRQSSQSRMVNGVGESVKQLIITLVPQKEGSLVIPAFSIKDKDGKEHSSNAITIQVKKVATDDEEDSQNANVDESSNQNELKSPEGKKENKIFNILLTIGLSLFVVVLAIIALAYFLGKKNKVVSNNEKNIEDAVIVEEKPKKIEKEEHLEEVEKVEFATASAALKVQYKEVSNEFYRKYFELFKKACCYKSLSISKDMTYDEMINKCYDLAGTNNIKQAGERLAKDIELVMYANAMPSRQLSAIDTDVKEILNSL